MSDYWDSNPGPASTEPVMTATYSTAPEPSTAVYPPTHVLGAIAAVVAVVALLFFVDSDVVHWFGYVLGAFGTAIGVVLYRHLDLVHRRSPAYIARSGYDYIATGLLLAGILLGMVHVFIALQETTVV